MTSQLRVIRENTAATLYAVVNEAPRMSRTQGPLAEVISGLLAKSPQARLIPDQAIPLLTYAASNAGATTGIAPFTSQPQWTAPARPASTPSVPAVLASAAAILLGVLLLTLPDEFALAFVAALAAAVWLIPVRRAKR